MIRIIWNQELYHSWGTKPQQKRREKQYNAEYYKKNKWRWYDDVKNGAKRAISKYGYSGKDDKQPSDVIDDLKRGAKKTIKTVKDYYYKDDSSKYKKEIEENLRNARKKREEEKKALEELERQREIQKAKEEAQRRKEEALERKKLLEEAAKKEKEKNKKKTSGKKSSGRGRSKGSGKGKKGGSGKSGGKGKGKGASKKANDTTPKPVDKTGGRNPHKKGRIDTIVVSRKMSTVPPQNGSSAIPRKVLSQKIGG